MVNVKKNILIISPVIPQRNLCAGDYRVWQLTKELKKYFNIFFMPLNQKSVSKPSYNELKSIVSQIIKPACSAAKFSKIIKQYNINFCLFEKYWDMPFEIEKFISISPNSIVDVHELGFLKTSALSKIQNIQHEKLYKTKELLFYKNAKLLIAINIKEQKELKKLFPKKQIVVIPTCTEINTKIYTPFSQRNDICFFGFYKYPPNADAVNYFAKNIFPKLQNKLQNIKFYVLGNGSKIFKNKYKNVIVKDKIKDISQELSKYKVFVCPLRYGAGLKKKILDAMNAKTPIVSTSFGFEGIKNLEKKSLPVDSNKFVQQIINIYSNKPVWNKMAKENFNIVKKYYCEKSFEQYIKTCVDKMNMLV